MLIKVLRDFGYVLEINTLDDDVPLIVRHGPPVAGSRWPPVNIVQPVVAGHASK